MFEAQAERLAPSLPLPPPTWWCPLLPVGLSGLKNDLFWIKSAQGEAEKGGWVVRLEAGRYCPRLSVASAHTCFTPVTGFLCEGLTNPGLHCVNTCSPRT